MSGFLGNFLCSERNSSCYCNPYEAQLRATYTGANLSPIITNVTNGNELTNLEPST